MKKSHLKQLIKEYIGEVLNDSSFPKKGDVFKVVGKGSAVYHVGDVIKIVNAQAFDDKVWIDTVSGQSKLWNNMSRWSNIKDLLEPVIKETYAKSKHMSRSLDLDNARDYREHVADKIEELAEDLRNTYIPDYPSVSYDRIGHGAYRMDQKKFGEKLMKLEIIINRIKNQIKKMEFVSEQSTK